MAGDGDYYDLGPHTWPIDGLSGESQRWFDRGLLWMYGYNHAEAIRCFDRCLALCPGCAVAEWGAAYALGPNYNAPWEMFGDAQVAAMRARALRAAELAAAPGSGALPRALAAALLLRYPQGSKEGCDTVKWSTAFADAMVAVAADFAEEADVQALAVEALMGITPWKMWDIKTGAAVKAPARAGDAARLLDAACARVRAAGRPPHPMLSHMAIHLFELSAEPERALPGCDALVADPRGTGHLTHMPTHVYILCGDYHSAVLWNDIGARADLRFLAGEGKSTFYTLYCAHNSHFKMYAAMFMGHYGHALSAADELDALLTEEFLRETSPVGIPFVNLGEHFVSQRYHVWVRFGRWAEILAHPLPADGEFYCVTTCTARYARSLAHALGAGDMRLAAEEQAEFQKALARVPADWQGIPGMGRRMHNNTSRDILKVSEKLLDGELAFRRGSHRRAFALLREAVRLEGSPPGGVLNYDEPWGFMQPVRHALGALLLDRQRYAEAEQVYREDLGLDPRVPRPYHHPDNVWALHGLCEALRAQGKSDPRAERLLRQAAARADVAIAASCYCRARPCCAAGGKAGGGAAAPSRLRDPADPGGRRAYSRDEFLAFYGSRAGAKVWKAALRASAGGGGGGGGGGKAARVVRE